MSPRTAAAIAAARTRRTPHGKGRFDPSEPLHMTTRHAAARNNGKANETPSLNGSVDDDDDRRGSFDEINVMSSQSLGSPNSAKGRRISGNSLNGTSAANQSFETQSSTGKFYNRSHSKPLSPVFTSTSPSRKRKRSTPTPPDSINGVEDSLVNSVTDMMEQDPRDFVEVVHPDQLSDRESEGSVESDEQFAADYLGATQSTENTPAATPLGSQAVSPVSEESNIDALFPAKPTTAAKTEVAQPPEPDEADEVEDAEELGEVDDADEVDDVEDGDDQVRDDLEGKPRRRLAGRRRAEHHDPQVEATMRRQLQLKSTFRSIARALKPVLAEIAHKTVENLEENPNLHEQVVEYQGTEEEAGIQKLLDDALARRKAQLDAQFRWNRENLQKTLQGEDKVRRSRCELQIADLRDLQLDRLEHDLLTVARTAQLNSGEPGYETEDEGDDVVPRPQGMGYRFTRTGALDSKYDSRSRLALECEKAVRDLQTRFDMFKMLKEVHEDDRPDGMTHFTTMDSTAREAADARRESVLNTQVLAEAAAESERRDRTPVMPVVPNEQAIGLQVLGDIAGSLPRAIDRPATPPQQDMAPQPRATPPSQMPPPFPQSNHLPMSFEGRLNDGPPRFPAFPERKTMPPASPIHPPPSRDRMPSQSPRRESFISSPMFHDRGKTLPPFHMQARDAEPNLQRQPLPPPPPPSQMRDIFGRDRPHRDIFGREIMRSEPAEPPHLGAQAREEPAWDHYQRTLNVDRSPRPPSQPDRSVHEFSQGGPLQIARVETSEPREIPTSNRGSSETHRFIIDPAGSGPAAHRSITQASPVIDAAPLRHHRQGSRGVLNRSSPLIDPGHSRPSFHEPSGSMSRPSPTIDSAFNRRPIQEVQSLVNHDSDMIDPALDRSSIHDVRGPVNYDSAMLDPALRPPTREARATDAAMIDPALGGPAHHDAAATDAALNRPQVYETGNVIAHESSVIDPALGGSLLQEEYHPGKHASPPFATAHARSQPPWESPSSPGAADSRERGVASPLLIPRDNVVEDLSKNPRSRTSSIMSQSTTTEASGEINVGGESTKRKSKSGSKQIFGLKPSRSDRRGSRKVFKEQNPSGRKSQGGKGPEGGPSVYRFRLNSIESTPSAPWSGSAGANLPRTSHASDPFAPASYASTQPGQPLPPPPPGSYPYTYPYDQNNQHRNSFPHTGSQWSPQQQSPLYAVPQPPQPPQPQPGGGPPPDQWPSPSAFVPPRLSLTPRNTQPAGPPPLAPATPDVARPLGPGGPSTNHLPAFAQQQRNQEANPRRRAHSEIQGHSFKHWAPRNTNR